MHMAALVFVDEHAPPGPGFDLRVLEFGSRDINGSVRQVFPRAARYVGVDVAEGPGADIVADAATVHVPGEWDVVVCCEVFEHADDTACAGMVANAYRHLTAGGVFIATMAGLGRAEHSAVDGGPLQPGEFYRNVDRPTLSGWLVAAGFTAYKTDVLGDDIRCVAWKE